MAATALETAPASITASGPPPGFRPYRLTIDRYHRMIAAGILTPDDRVYLWKGWLVEKMPKGRLHTRTGKKLYDTVLRLVPTDWHVLQEQPITLGDNTEPEPDLAVVRGALDDYPDRPPSSRDVALLVEVADSTVAHDSLDKLATYARESIPIYWLVNIPQRRIEVYWRPAGPRYAEHTFYGLDEQVPLILDDHQIGAIPVRDLLP